jgi:hypothetical protein
MPGGSDGPESPRQRYELALERMKQAAFRLRETERLGPHVRGRSELLTAYRAEAETARRAFESLLREIS